MAPRERHSIITGTGSCIPGRTVTNNEFLHNRFFASYGEPLDPANTPGIVAKFQEITDIAERRHATDDLLASDLACAAASEALASAGIDPESLDYVIVAHNFGDVRADNPRSDFVPSLAARVKQKLGIRNPFCVAYDLPFGCPGWLQARDPGRLLPPVRRREQGPGDRRRDAVPGVRPARPRQHALRRRCGGGGDRGDSARRAGGDPGPRHQVGHPRARAPPVDGHLLQPGVRGQPAVPQDARPHPVRVRAEHRARCRPPEPGEGGADPFRRQEGPAAPGQRQDGRGDPQAPVPALRAAHDTRRASCR